MARNFDLSVRLRTAVEGLKDVTGLIQEIEELGGETQSAAKQSRQLGEELQELERTQQLVDDFRKLRTEVGRTGNELHDAQSEAQRLGRELKETEQPTQKLQKSFDRARRNVTRLKNAQIDQTQALQKNRRALTDAGYSSQQLSQAQSQIRRSSEATSEQIERLNKRLRDVRDQTAKEFKDPTDRLERGARRSGEAVQGLGSRLRRVATIAVSSAAAFFGIREAIQGITGIARVGGEFEILQKRLEAITGSAEDGQEAFQWIRQFTRDTPFQLEQVTDAFVRAKAFGLDPMDGTLQAIADQAAKTGGGMEALNGIVTALGQAYSKGKIQAEEMLQLVERGVPAWDLLAQATGKSVAELQKLTTAGKLGREEISLLVEELGRSAAGAAESQMQTLQGLVSNLKDTWTQFLVEVNNQGLMEYLKEQIRGIADEFQRMRDSGELEQWAKRVSNSIIGLIETVKTVGGVLIEYRDAILATAKAWAVYKVAQASVGMAQFAQMSINVAAASMLDLDRKTRGAAGRMGKFGAAIRAVPGPAKILALAAAFLGFDKVLIKGGESLGRWAGQFSEAAQQLEETRKRIREQAEERLASLDKERDALERYRAVQQVNADEAARLSEEQRQALEEQLQGNEALMRVEAQRALTLQQLGVNVDDSLKAVREGLDATRASLDALDQASTTASDALDNGISAAAQRLVERFEEMRHAGESAGDAVKAVFADFDVGNTTAIREIVEAVGAIAEQSAEAGEALNKEISERLQSMTGGELRRFSIALQGAFDGGIESASRFADLADQIADAALQNIGTSLQEIRTGISGMEESALESFASFTESGTRSADEVRQAVAALQDDISSPEAVDKLEQMLEAWAASSGQSIDEVRAALDELAADVEGTAQQIAAELTDAINAAGDEDSLNETRDRINELWNSGKIGAETYTTLLAAAQEKQFELGEQGEATGQRVAAGMKQAADATKGVGDAADEAQSKIDSAMSGARSMAEGIAGFYNNTTEKLIRLSQRAHDAFVSIGGDGPPRGMDATEAKIEQISQRIRDLRLVADYGFTGITTWFRDTAARSAEVERAFYQQKLAAESLVDQFERGNYSAADLNLTMEDLQQRFTYLDEEDLSNLHGAISRARSEVNALSDSLNDTIASLRQELAGLQGDSVEVERLRYQEQRLELEERLNEAREYGDQQAIQAAQEALQLQEQAYQLRVQQAQQRKEEEQQRAAEEAARQEQEQQRQEVRQREQNREEYAREERQEQPQQQAGRTVRAELTLPSGRTAAVSGSENDINDLFEYLGEIGARTAGQ